MKRTLTHLSPVRLASQLVILILLLGLQPGIFLNAAPLTTIEKDVAFAPGGDVNNNGLADPGDTLRYTVDITNATGTDMTNVQFTDTIDPNTTLVGGSVEVSPVAADDSFTAQRDTVLNAPAPGFLANDTLNGAIISAPPNTAQGGTVVLSVDGSFVYTPPAGFYSPPTDSFTYTLTNSTGADTATVTLTVLPPAPVASDDSYIAERNTTLIVPAGTGVLFNDSSLFGATVTAYDATSTQGGTVSVAADGSFTYQPPSDFISPPDDTFTYTITNAGGSDTATVTITVNAPLPIANDDSYDATENTALNVPAASGVLSNDTNLFGGVVTAYDANSSQGGTVTMAADGSFTYTPPVNFVSPPADTFTYTVTNSGGSDTATVTITVSDLPAANPDSYTATRNTQLVVPAGSGVLFNDTGLGISITAFDAASAQGGTVNLAADGSFTYDPPTNFLSPPDDTFTYTISNVAGSDVGTVTITVNPPAPNAVDDTYNATEDTVLNVPAGTGLLFNDANLFGGTVTAFDSLTTRGGTVSVSPDGSFTYTPPAGTISPPDDTFTYTVTNAGGFDSATVRITITDIPAANDDVYTAAIDTPLVVPAASGVLFNDTGTGAAVTAYDATSTQGGTVSMAADGGFTYTPPAGFSSPPDDTFTYTISNIAGSDTATVTITVIPPPTANPDNYIAGQDTQLVVPAGSGVLFNDTDLFGGTVTAFDATSAQGGTVSVAADGSFTYDPPTGFISPPDDTFTYTVTNGAGSDVGTVTITVIPPPEANNDTYSAHGNLSIVIPDGANDLLANDVLNGAVISAYDPVSAQGGIVSVNADGSFVYVPPPGFEGADTFTYTLDNALTDTATVTINVSGMIWFIDSSAPPGGLGTFNLPFNSLSAFNTVNNGTGNNPAAGDRIFIYQRGTTYAGGITLLNNQQLIGQGEDLSALVGALPLGSPILPGATSNPSITNNSGPVISLNNGNDIRGLNTTGPAGDAITGNNTIGGSFQNITISGATSSGIFLNGTPSGTFTFASNVTIDATTTGVAFFVNGGNANITFSGSITKTDTNTLVYIANTTGGTITFQTGTLSATNGDGIYLENVDGTVNFNGTTTLNGGNARVRILAGSSGSFTFGTGTNITNPTGTPFSVNASSPTVTYSGSMSKSSAGLLVDLTTVSSGTITFQTGTLSATDGDGILLDNADGTVNFNGTTTLNGGNARVRIQNGSAGTVNFANATITNPTGTAFTIFGSSPSGTYTGSISKNNAGTLVNLTTVSGGTYTFAADSTLSATNGDGLLFFNADGTVNFNGTTTLNGGSARVRIESGSSGTFNFSNGTITNPTTGVSFLISSSSPSGTFNGNISASGNYVLEATGMTGGSYAFTGGTLTATGASSGARIVNSAGSISAAALTVGSSGSPLSIDGLTLTINTGTYTFTALNIHTTGAGNNAIAGITAGTLNSSSGAISSSGAAAIDINGATLGMTLTSVSANGGANGISLQNTTGSFTIAGGGDTSLGGNSSGGTIQNSTGAGINLNNVASPSFTNVTIQNTQGSGITGSQVSNFTFRNGTITNSGLSAAAFTSNINFNDNAANTSISMLTGTVNISGNILSNAFYSGVDIQNYTGAVSDLTVSGNQITSSTSMATSVAPGIRILAYSGADVTRATISNNTVTNFPSDAGIMVVGGNATEGGNSSDFGVPGSATDIIAITGNTISGQSATNRIGTQGILVGVNGSGTGNFNISNNSVSHTVGNSISLNVFGDAVVVSTINNNTIVSNNTFGARGIAGGVGVATGFATNTPSLTATVEGNNISQTDGNGIFFVANENVVSNADWEITLKINNNIVAAPLTGFRSGIQVNAGGATGDNDIRLEINGNTSDGSVSTTVEGIGLRKQGTDPNLNAFAIEGLSPSPNTLGSQVINHVNSLNPAGGGTLLVSAETGFTAAVVPLLAEGGENAGSFNGAALMPAHLPGIAEAAAARWAATGLSAAQIARLAAINVTTAELPDGVLAYAYPDRIEIDASAAGYGWFVDPSPDDDSEFSRIAAPTEYRAAADSPAFGQMDLLTAIMHEYGHILGLDDAPSAANPHALMAETLPTGTRRFPLAHMAGDKPDPGVLRLALIPALSGETVSTSIHTLPAGDTVRIIFDVTVDNPLPAGVTQVCNQGTISGLLSGVPFSEVTDDPNTAAADDSTCTPVSAAPIMDATKTASDLNGGSAVPGDEIEYTITISNSGNQDAGSVTLNDPIPANTTYVAGSTTLNGSSAADTGGAMPYASGGLVNSPGAAAGDVEAGQSAVIVFRVTVNDPFPAGVNTISNQGTISGVGFTPFLTDDPGVGGADDPTVTTIIAGLTFSKDFLTDPILTGETSTLQFTITNPAGNPALTNLSFTDDLPPGLVYVSPVTTPQCDGTVTLIDADSLTFTDGSLGAGDSACTIEVTVESNGAALGSLTNTTSPLTADGGITAAPATAVIFIGVPPTATPPGGSNGVFNFPTPPATPLCVDENFNPNSVIRASIPDRLRTSVFCRLLVQNGEYVSYLGYFITNPAQIGLQSVLDSSVFQAVDVFSPNGPQSYPEGALICLRGTGTLLFLSASEAPRSARTVEGFPVDDFAGYTCVVLYEPGTLVMIPSSTGVQPAAAPPAAAGITELTNCMITTQYIARLRAEPNTSSAILDQVPYQLMLQATAYTNGWYRVIFGSQQGWISETLLTTTGNCG